jgi:hypothetical protein
MTNKIKANPGVVETVIDMLSHIEVDGETMEYILRQVGMEEQMLRQLIMSSPIEPKQETLEEANWKVLGTKNDTFYNGAKWQEQRMFSEEDLIQLLNEKINLPL